MSMSATCGLPRDRPFDALEAVVGDLDAIARRLEELLQALPEIAVVFDDEDAGGARVEPARSPSPRPAPGAAPQEVADGRRQIERVEGLRDVHLEPDRERADAVLLARVGGDRERRDLPRPADPARLAGGA